MWFRLGVQNFIAKKTLNGDSCDIFVSDFTRIWHKTLSNNEIISISQQNYESELTSRTSKRSLEKLNRAKFWELLNKSDPMGREKYIEKRYLQALNPLLEASVEKLKEITLNLLEDIKAFKEVKEENNNVSLKLQSSILGVKFQFQVVLNEGDGEMLYREFTLPLLIMLMNMQNREKKLLKIIKDKDAEIKDYKQEYGPRLKYLETKIFNIKEFNSQESNISFDPVPFLECIDAKLQSVEATHLPKQKEPQEDESSKTNLSHKCDAKKSVFKDKSSNNSSGPRSCIFLDNQTIKKRKSHNEGFRIKF